MRSKKVTRYYCDYCRKGGFFGPRMQKHEQGCTKNPNRICGLCDAAELDQQSMESLMAALQKDVAADKPNGEFEIEIGNLREAASNCPACIVAALRQASAERYFAFKASDEFAKFWKEVNLSREQCY